MKREIKPIRFHSCKVHKSLQPKGGLPFSAKSLMLNMKYFVLGVRPHTKKRSLFLGSQASKRLRPLRESNGNTTLRDSSRGPLNQSGEVLKVTVKLCLLGLRPELESIGTSLWLHIQKIWPSNSTVSAHGSIGRAKGFRPWSHRFDPWRGHIFWSLLGLFGVCIFWSFCVVVFVFVYTWCFDRFFLFWNCDFFVVIHFLFP